MPPRDYLRAEEERRIREIRQIVLTSTNNVPVQVDDVVEGGRFGPGEPVGEQGVVVGHQTRLGRVMRQPAADRTRSGNDSSTPQGQPALGRRRRRGAGDRAAAQGRAVAARPATTSTP